MSTPAREASATKRILFELAQITVISMLLLLIALAMARSERPAATSAPGARETPCAAISRPENAALAPLSRRAHGPALAVGQPVETSRHPTGRRPQPSLV